MMLGRLWQHPEVGHECWYAESQIVHDALSFMTWNWINKEYWNLGVLVQFPWDYQSRTFQLCKKISWIDIWSFFISTVNTFIQKKVCQMAFWFVNVVKPQSLPLKLSSFTTWCTAIVSIDPPSGFQSSWFGPYRGLYVWVNHLAWCNGSHRAVSFRVGDPYKSHFPLHPKHSQTIDTRARWGRTLAEYNSLFCIPFSKLLVAGWISKKISNFYVTLTLQVEHLQKDYV